MQKYPFWRFSLGLGDFFVCLGANNFFCNFGKYERFSCKYVHFGYFVPDWVTFLFNSEN